MAATVSAKEMRLALQLAEIKEKLAEGRAHQNDLQLRMHELQCRENAVAEITRANAEWEIKLSRQTEELKSKESALRGAEHDGKELRQHVMI